MNLHAYDAQDNYLKLYFRFNIWELLEIELILTFPSTETVRKKLMINSQDQLQMLLIVM